MINNKISRFVAASSLFFAFSASIQLSHADSNHAIGLTYASGFVDVYDWHDNNLAVEDSVKIPVGISYRYINTFDSDLRMDVGVGPIGAFIGDIEYVDIPVQLTLGYNFFKDGGFSPYVRGGITYHFNNGDYVESSAGLGFLGALGAEMGSGRVKFFAEVAIDTAEATFSTAEGEQSFVTKNSQEDIAVLDVHFTAGVKF